MGDCLSSKEECANITDIIVKDQHWFIFNNMCLSKCPEGYHNVSKEENYCKKCDGYCPKVCNSIEITETKTLFLLTNCTIINGSLSISLSSDPPESFLIEHLGKIEEVYGYFQIHKMNNIKSLDFLQSLRVVHGNLERYSGITFIISQNAGLESLWNNKRTSIELKKGDILIHDNPQLCRKLITKLISSMTINKNASDNVLYNNGKQKACDPPIYLNVKIVRYGSTFVTLNWDDYNEQLHNQNSSVVVYLINYLEKTGNNLTWDDNNCEAFGFQTLAVENNVGTLKKLKPYTTYVYFIKILSNETLNDMDVSVTELHEFVTLPDDPSKPVDAFTVSKSHDTIELSWKPPREINGELTYYFVTVYRQKDDIRFLEKRDYCHSPYLLSAVKPKKQAIDEKNTKIVKELNCDCDKQEPIVQNEVIELNEFDSLCSTMSSASIQNSSCKKFIYNSYTTVPQTISSSNNNTRSSVKENLVIRVGEQMILPDKTEYIIRNLTHFSMYVIFLNACNKNKNKEPLCSGYIMLCQRTLKKNDADDIPKDVTVNVKDNIVYVYWREPPNANALITSYDIKYRLADSENAQTLTDCVTRLQHKRRGHRHVINQLPPGKYKLSIKAYSIAGGGRPTNFIEFEIDTEIANTTIISVCIVIFLCSSLIILYVYLRYKKKQGGNLHLITEVNPDYSESHYVVDPEWEVDRSDVEKLEELGQGSFGKVYSGYIKSMKIPCAIKTIDDSSSTHERIEFLNEAHVMKSFCKAYHVVRLLGIVSKTTPPLVIMELMERGDLKSFLRRSRDSSNNITCPEMYRMAVEIADGMYYLSTKKFVHRDLAARNCMVAADHTVKIGDFGMARDIYETDYYRKETRGLFPVRWMSPESLADGVFTTDSDVWSYGIVLWEMATLAEQPYQGLSNEQVLQFVISRGTLTRPKDCPDLLWEIMQFCWCWKPINRPTFGNIVAKLETYVGPGFQAVSFFHSRDGEEYRLNATERIYNRPAQSTVPETENVAHWNASDDDDVSLYSESNRPNRYLSYPHQRQNRSSNKYNLDDSPSFDFN